MVFGKHLIIDANECQGEIRDKQHIQNFIDDLCELSKMEKKGETQFIYFEDNDYNRYRDIVGWTITQVISLSNITIHINEISRTIYFDFFTCSEIKEDLINVLFQNYFRPKQIKKIILNRDAINNSHPFVV